MSIGLPVRDGERFVAHAIESILAQTYTDWELVICDNASDDATPEIAADYAARDQRISFLRNDRNLGAGPNYNRVFREARGELFKWAPHDDGMAPTYLARCVEAFDDAPPSLVAVYPRTYFIDEHGEPLRECLDRMGTTRPRPAQRLADAIRAHNRAGAVLGLIRSEMLARTRLIDSFISSDYVLLAELAMLGDIVELPEFLMLRRLHPGMHRLAHRTHAEVLEWFDSDLRGRRVLWTHGRLVIEMLRSVHRLALPPRDRLICYVTVPAVYAAHQARIRGGHWTAPLRDRIGARRRRCVQSRSSTAT